VANFSYFPSFAFGLVATFIVGSSSLATSVGTPLGKPSTLFVAESTANDRSAKRIRNEVAEEGLKTITTKEEPASANASDVLVVQGTSNEQLAVDHLESGPSILNPEVKVETAPGLREPASTSTKQETHKSEPSKHPGHSGTESKAPAPDVAQKWLEHGNKRYVSSTVRSDGRKAADRKKLVSGQAPHAIVLSCSDSRVPPETVFDQALGEIFVVRTAGESLDSAVIASIEYAVEHLGPQLIVVMGHTSCGAVKAALNTSLNDSAGSAALDQMIAEIRPRIPGGIDRAPSSSSSHALEIESAANAQGVASELTKRSEIIRTRVLKGQLKIKPALYYLDSGLVKFY
jgi:carbonic anhydrase